MLVNKGYDILADIPGYLNPTNLFINQRPGIVVCFKNLVCAIELTICFETNFNKSRKYKEERHKKLKRKYEG